MSFSGESFKEIFDFSHWTGEDLLARSQLGLGLVGWAGIWLYPLRNTRPLAFMIGILLSGVTIGEQMLGLKEAWPWSAAETAPYFIQSFFGRNRKGT